MPWLTLFALLLILVLLLFRSSLALMMLSQMGYLVIICLSYNILFGQGGMLSFGHAVYTGMGAFIAIHAMNLATQGSLPVPLVLVPLVGGLGGMFLRGPARFRDDQEVRHHLCHDHPGHRRAGRIDGLDVPGLLRRRRRRHDQSGVRDTVPGIDLRLRTGRCTT